MKVAINAAFLLPRGGGIKEYILNLITNISALDKNDTFVVYVLADYIGYARDVLPKADNIVIKPIPFDTGSLLKKAMRSLTEVCFWRKEERTERWDLFHSPFFHAPSLKRTPVVITVHDMRFFRFPKTYAWARYQFLRHAVKSSVRRAARIITISEFTKSEIIAAYGTPADKITVIHEAINPGKFSEANASASAPAQLEGSDFILTVGHLEPRKNYDRLIEAFRTLKADPAVDHNLRLVIVGQKGCYYDSTLRLIEDTPDVLYLNFVSDETLIWLYKHTRLFVFPSIYEGFGFPPLEAASLGVVSAASNVSSIPEVCGDGVEYFDPYDVADMTRALKTVLTDETLRTNLLKKIRLRLDHFSWLTNAAETLKVYRQTAKK